MTEKILKEAAAATGGLFAVDSAEGPSEIVYENGEFRIGVCGGTLLVKGLDESRTDIVALVAGLLAADAAEEQELHALGDLLGCAVPLEEAVVSCVRAGISDIPRVVFLVQSVRAIDNIPEPDDLGEAFTEDAGDLIYPVDPGSFVIAKRSGEDFDPKAFAGMIADTMMTEIMISVRVSYSRVTGGLFGLREAYEQAKKAMRTLAISDRGDVTLGFSDRGFGGLVAEADTGTCLEFIEEYYEDRLLPGMDESLTHAASKFLRNSLNISETARDLYMHRNTFIYQLDKIEKITGLNLRNFNDAMTYRLLSMADRRLNDEDRERI